MAQLKMKAKEVGWAPCDECISSKNSQNKIDEKTNQSEGPKKIKDVAAPKNNVEAIKDKW